jgi:ketosteroid isomerase-like protein
MPSTGAAWMPGCVSSAQRSYGSPCPSLGFETSTAGGAEAREWIEQLLEVFEEVHLEIDEITALSDDRVLTVASVTGRGRGSGIPVERPSWEVVWLADGLITRRQVFWTRDEALEAAGLRE